MPVQTLVIAAIPNAMGDELAANAAIKPNAI
jgi:hypothetical protein